MAFYNVSKIENWFDDFTSCKNKFINTYYDDYQDSYIRTCNDEIIRKMKTQLDNHYNKIKRIYNRINDHWSNYLNDLKNIDNCIAGTSNPFSVYAPAPAAKLNSLPCLKEYEANLATKIESFSGYIGTVTFLGWSEDKDTSENLLYIFERTGATVGTAVVSVIEGIGMFGEGIVDVCTTVVSECYCQVRLVVDDDFTEKQADIIRESTRDVVSTQYVKNKFDSFYQESDVGAYLSENAYAFDAVRSIGNEVGIVVGAVVVSSLTQGAIPPSVLYGISKAGNHIEENFQDENNGYFESIVKGGLAGALDGVFFAAGAKGDQVLKATIGKSAAKNLFAFGGKMGYEAFCAVSQDGSNIVLDSLFMDNQIVDNNGNTIYFENYKDKLSYCYEQAGGKEAIIESLVTSVVLSGMSDGVDTIKAVRNIDAGSAIKNIDVSSSSIDTNASGISKQIDEVTSKTSIFNEENIAALNNKIAKDNFVGIKVDSEADIPDDIWERISRPKNDKDVWITTSDGKKFYWGEDVHPRMLESKSIETSVSDEDLFPKTKISSSKYKVDELYRKNNEKYKYIPGYQNYYDLQRIQRISSNLDAASKILNDWGKNQGFDNYAEIALRKYANTGSVLDDSGNSYITRTGGVRDYIASLDKNDVSMYLQRLHNSTLTKSDLNTLYTFFKNFGSSYDSTYGVDQGSIESLCTYTLNGKEFSYREARDIVNTYKERGIAIPIFKKTGTKEYFELKDKLISRGFNNSQASVILSSVDDVGACSYAAKANSIFYQFSNNPKLFEERFGFPMYKVSSDGKTVLNSTELLLDMYVFANDTDNGGNLFSRNYDGSYLFFTDNRIDVFGKPMLNTENQAYLSALSGSNNFILSKYLNSKGLKWDSYNLIENLPNSVLPDNEFNSYINAINASINEGKSVQLNITSVGNNINLYSTNPKIYGNYSTKDWVRRETNSFGNVEEKHAGHAVFITGMDRDGFFVSSWGREFKILFDELKNGGQFNITIDNII